MRKTIFFAIAAMLGTIHVALAGTNGNWPASSTASIAITGDITVSRNTLTFGNGTRLKLSPIGKRNGKWSPLSKITSGEIYQLKSPSSPTLLNGNTLCGSPVTFVVLSEFSPGSLSLTAFTGTKTPQGFGDSSCAAYFYER